MNIGSILIVDDEELVRLTVKEMLKDKASRIIAVESGSQALKILSRERFDIILTDVNMPDMNGFQLIEYVKLIDPMIPIIVMTGYGGIYDLREAMAKGAEEYIVKPFKQDGLESAIDRVLLHSALKRNEIMLKYVSIANSLISKSNEPNKDELIIIGRRIAKYIENPAICPDQPNVQQI
jgi:DNA-binding NtrC family response regulator